MRSLEKKKTEKYTPGTLVRIKIRGLNYINDGFATVGRVGSQIELFEFIDLVSYPSTDDFLGSSILVEDGEAAMVLKYVGRPDRITRDPVWFAYDVYQVLVAGKTCMVFSQNLDPLV